MCLGLEDDLLFFLSHVVSYFKNITSAISDRNIIPAFNILYWITNVNKHSKHFAMVVFLGKPTVGHSC